MSAAEVLAATLPERAAEAFVKAEMQANQRQTHLRREQVAQRVDELMSKVSEQFRYVRFESLNVDHEEPVLKVDGLRLTFTPPGGYRLAVLIDCDDRCGAYRKEPIQDLVSLGAALAAGFPHKATHRPGLSL